MKLLLGVVVILCFLSVQAHPKTKTIEKCTAINCKIYNNCRCSTTENPITSLRNPAPRLVAITFNDAITQGSYDNYWKPLFFNRTNSDGSPVGLTFYVPHEFTDYALVHDLYIRGYEIGSHSITKNSNITNWETAAKIDLQIEFGGQKEIISKFANIPYEDITGVRSPLLKLNADESINAYQSSDFKYDSSWTTSLKLLPYTLNYKSTQICQFKNCLNHAHADFWIVPVISLKDMNKKECDYISSCKTHGTALEISKWLYSNIQNVNRAPIVLLLDIKWFQSVENSFNAFSLFLDRVKNDKDVFLVTVQDVLKWMKNPVSANIYTVPDHSGREKKCLQILCPLQNAQGQKKYMMSCVSCPEAYPWRGNPNGNVI